MSGIEWIVAIVGGAAVGIAFFFYRHGDDLDSFASAKARESLERERAKHRKLLEQRERTRIAHARKKELQRMGKRR